ncbi:MAG TPA: dihydrofolate reductase family protein [Trebonia sp.]|nr:dihydrofolate reductase family protein [Trebonia sp.]
MRTIFPSPGGELDLTALAAAYAYPEGGWLRVNFVQSADGAASLGGLSGGLSSAGDKRVFGILRVLADVIVAGAGTVRAENYRPARARPALAELRAGRPAAAPIAVVSQSLDLDLDAPLYTEAAPDSRTIVITSASADPGRRAAAAKVADVIVAGKDTVDLSGALAMLAGRGLGRVLCEGGPRLFGELDAAGLVDELCLSLSPTLAGPGPARIISGPASPARPMTLHQVIADEGFLFCRYFTGKRTAEPAA